MCDRIVETYNTAWCSSMSELNWIVEWSCYYIITFSRVTAI